MKVAATDRIGVGRTSRSDLCKQQIPAKRHEIDLNRAKPTFTGAHHFISAGRSLRIERTGCRGPLALRSGFKPVELGVRSPAREYLSPVGPKM